MKQIIFKFILHALLKVFKYLLKHKKALLDSWLNKKISLIKAIYTYKTIMARYA
jgi:hypothetical protein